MKKMLLIFGLLFVGIFAAACTPSVKEATTIIGVDINPSIEFTVNEDYEVVSFRLVNEDAEIVAADLDFIGMNFDEALDLYLEAAIEAGYIDVNREDNAILITVANDDEEKEEEIRERVRNNANMFFHKHSIGGVILEAEISNEEIYALALEYEVSPGKVRIALAAQASDEELLLENLVTLSVRELMQVIHANHMNKLGEFIQERKQMRIEEKEAMREQMKDRIQEHRNRVEDREEFGLTEEQRQEMINEFLQNMEQKRNEYQERMEEMREQARKARQQNRP